MVGLLTTSKQKKNTMQRSIVNLPTSDELLRRESRPEAYALTRSNYHRSSRIILLAHAVVLAGPLNMWSAEMTGAISHFVVYKILM